MQNFKVVIPEMLLILKQGAEQDREKSVKGEKDRIDIMTLLFYTDIDFKKYFKILKKYDLEHFYKTQRNSKGISGVQKISKKLSWRLKRIINSFEEIDYLDLNPREFKLKKEETLKKLKML